MKTSQKGIDLLKSFEGCVLHPYLDSAGIATIAYGSTYYPDGRKVTMNDPVITQAQAEQLLATLLVKYEDPINAYCQAQNITLNQNQFDAVVSARYNLGNVKAHLDAFKAGKLTKDFWCQYSYAGGQFLPGLYNRRVKEWELFNTPVVTPNPLQDKIDKIKPLLEQINNILK